MTTLNYKKLILVIVLPPFNLGQLLREDNEFLGETYVYTYDNAGNILSKKTYALTAAGTTPSSSTSTFNYGYSTSGWGDMLTSYRGYYYDLDLGLYYLNTRYYDAKTGRFISADDPIKLGMNLKKPNHFIQS